MKDLNDIKDIWQQETVKIDSTKLKKINKGLNYINIQYKVRRLVLLILTITMIGAMSFAIQDIKSYTFIIGAVVLSSILLFITIIFWKNGDISKFRDHSLSNKDCLNRNIKTLIKLKNIPTKYLPTYCIFVVIGINLLYFDLLTSHSITERALLHTSSTLVFSLTLYKLVKFKIRVVSNKINPIIDELNSLLTNLNS